jgi:hypothetical protein
MMSPDPTPTQVRHLQNQLEALLDSKEHRSALKEGAKSWSWEKARKRLRKKRRAFDHKLVEIFNSSPVPTPENLHSRFDDVWTSEVEDGLRASWLDPWSLVKGIGTMLVLKSPVGVAYAALVKKTNDRWKAYCKECVRIAKEKAERHLSDEESSD